MQGQLLPQQPLPTPAPAAMPKKRQAPTRPMPSSPTPAAAPGSARDTPGSARDTPRHQCRARNAPGSAREAGQSPGKSETPGSARDMFQRCSAKIVEALPSFGWLLISHSEFVITMDSPDAPVNSKIIDDWADEMRTIYLKAPAPADVLLSLDAVDKDCGNISMLPAIPETAEVDAATAAAALLVGSHWPRADILKTLVELCYARAHNLEDRGVHTFLGWVSRLARHLDRIPSVEHATVARTRDAGQCPGTDDAGQLPEAAERAEQRTKDAGQCPEAAELAKQ